MPDNSAPIDHQSQPQAMACSHLILGGARSGKSRYGEQLAAQSGKNVVYLATATSHDDEMAQRIKQHQQDRPASWPTVDCPIQLPQAIDEHGQAQNVLLVDCLTLWLMNVMMESKDLVIAVDELLLALKNCQAQVFLVSNEITMGVVPMGELSRNYVDELGRLHQRIAAQANNVTLMVAGIPMVVKSDAN